MLGGAVLQPFLATGTLILSLSRYVAFLAKNVNCLELPVSICTYPQAPFLDNPDCTATLPVDRCMPPPNIGRKMCSWSGSHALENCAMLEPCIGAALYAGGSVFWGAHNATILSLQTADAQSCPTISPNILQLDEVGGTPDGYPELATILSSTIITVKPIPGINSALNITVSTGSTTASSMRFTVLTYILTPLQCPGSATLSCVHVVLRRAQVVSILTRLRAFPGKTCLVVLPFFRYARL